MGIKGIPPWAKNNALVRLLKDNKGGELKFYCWANNGQGTWEIGMAYSCPEVETQYGASSTHPLWVKAMAQLQEGIEKAFKEGWRQ